MHDCEGFAATQGPNQVGEVARFHLVGYARCHKHGHARCEVVPALAEPLGQVLRPRLENARVASAQRHYAGAERPRALAPCGQCVVVLYRQGCCCNHGASILHDASPARNRGGSSAPSSQNLRVGAWDFWFLARRDDAAWQAPCKEEQRSQGPKRPANTRRFWLDGALGPPRVPRATPPVPSAAAPIPQPRHFGRP